MWPLPKPAHALDNILSRCCTSMNNTELANRIGTATSSLEAVSENYEALGTAGLLHTIPPADSVDGVVSQQEMEWLYTNKFSKKGSPLRVIYDEILAAVPNEICPLCGQKQVRTLDHYLAKSLHPALAVTPINLVPACRDCNMEKLAHQPTCAEEQTMHPYYDNIEDGIWLLASVIEETPPALQFFVDPPLNWPAIKAARVRFHFSSLKLARLYGVHAAAELIQIQFALLKVNERGGSDAVRLHLSDQAESRRMINRNSWQAAMYSALSNSAWFCEGGLRLVRVNI